MAEPQSSKTAAAATGVFEGTELSTPCCRRSFKPKTDEAKAAVEQAVRTLAEQALSQTKLICPDVVKSIEAMIAELDRKLSEQINLIMHHAGFPEARRRLARAALSRQQHRDRRDAEDPRHEHLESGCRQDAEALQGHGLGPESASSRRSTRSEYGTSAASRSAAWSATITSTTPRPMSSCWVKSPRSPQRPILRSSPALADGHADGLVAGAGQSARSDQDLPDARIRSLALAARIRRLALHRARNAAFPGPAAVRREDRSGRGLRLRGRSRAPRTTRDTPGRTRPMRWRRTSRALQALRLVLAHSRHRVRRCGGRPARAHVSRPTTAAST